jgi:hypothetical protein
VKGDVPGVAVREAEVEERFYLASHLGVHVRQLPPYLAVAMPDKLNLVGWYFYHHLPAARKQ